MTQTPDTHPVIKALEALKKPIPQAPPLDQFIATMAFIEYYGDDEAWNAAITASIDAIQSMIVGEEK